MASLVTNILEKVKNIAKKYPAVLAGIIIYIYYLITSFNFFQTAREKQTLIDYIMQFDSLFFLWIVAAAFLHIDKMRQRKNQEFERLRQIERAVERQKISEELINDIMTLLQDNLNNPLAVISVTSQEIRRKFENDKEINLLLKQIESSIQRIHNTIRDIQVYEVQKLSKSTTEILSPSK